MVPLFDITRQNQLLESALFEKAEEVIRSGRFILGPEVEAFEKEAAAVLGLEDAVFVSSGTDALLVALMAIGIGPGDEVILPSFTFFATAGAVSRLGARPVFADVCPVCFNLSAESTAARLSDRTRAIIPVHLFGQSAEMQPLLEIAESRGIPILEDVAQSFGAHHRGTACGAFSALSAFSFFPTKNLGGFGDSGLVSGRDPGLLERVRRLRLHGSNPKYYHPEIGGNFRGDPLQSALLRLKLPHLGEWIAARASNASLYLDALGALPGVIAADAADCCCPPGATGAAASARIVLPVAYPHNQHTWNQFTIRVTGGQRDALRDFLRARGVGCEIYYPLSLHQQACFADTAPDACPIAEALSSEVLSLPIFPELTAAEIQEVIAAIGEWLDP